MKFVRWLPGTGTVTDTAHVFSHDYAIKIETSILLLLFSFILKNNTIA